MYRPLTSEIYALAVLAGPVEDCGTCCAAVPVPTLPASCLEVAISRPQNGEEGPQVTRPCAQPLTPHPLPWERVVKALF
jgi:hypothetical protein